MFKKIILFFSLVLCAFAAFAQDFPERSTTLVTDYTNTLSADDKQRLESKLVAFDDTSSTQIAIVMIRSVGNYDIGEYGAALGRKWGIGQKGKNNGILILVAINDRKLTIQTGYGAEGALPDIITQQIRVNDINPRFKAGDYYGGLNAGVDQIIKYTKGEYKADKKPQAKHNGGGGGSAFFVIIIVIVILVIIFRNRGGGGGRQIIGSRGGASPFWWFLAGNMLGGGRSGGDWGGFSGGGGNDSGGGDSGGFGGFGGGDFGGGGSNGSW